MKHTLLIFACLLAFALSPLWAEEDGITAEMAIQLVQTAVKNIKADVPGTFAKISAGEHPYKDKDNTAYYVFVYDTEVNIVAHPTTSLVGRNYKGKPDVKGKNFRDEIVSTATEKGKGWVDYFYQKPGEPGMYVKTTYFEAVKGSDGKTYIAACGRYK